VKDTIVVRDAKPEDTAAIAALEARIWGGLGTPCYGEDHVRAWLETHPAGLQVAEKGGRIVGYQYAQIISYRPEDAATFPSMDVLTDDGYTRRSHRPDGNAVYCVSICSEAPGAGRVLAEQPFRLARASGLRYVIGLSRLPGLSAYWDSLPADVRSGIDSVAAWYAYGVVTAFGGGSWPGFCPAPLPFPPPTDDPVLGKYVRIPGFGVAAVLKGRMRDPESRDYGALVVKDMQTS
jgi:hypothetical protein